MKLNLLDLPREILLTQIFRRLSFSTLCRLSQVSKYLHNLIQNDNILWSQLIPIEFSDQPRDMTNNGLAYFKFKELYLARERDPWIYEINVYSCGYHDSVCYHYATCKSVKETNPGLLTRGIWEEITADEQRNVFSSSGCPLEKIRCANCKRPFTNGGSFFKENMNGLGWSV